VSNGGFRSPPSRRRCCPSRRTLDSGCASSSRRTGFATTVSRSTTTNGLHGSHPQRPTCREARFTPDYAYRCGIFRLAPSRGLWGVIGVDGTVEEEGDAEIRPRHIVVGVIGASVGRIAVRGISGCWSGRNGPSSARRCWRLPRGQAMFFIPRYRTLSVVPCFPISPLH
jgi:hypothetical protein